jgi:hypothetical protein
VTGIMSCVEKEFKIRKYEEYKELRMGPVSGY